MCVIVSVMVDGTISSGCRFIGAVGVAVVVGVGFGFGFGFSVGVLDDDDDDDVAGVVCVSSSKSNTFFTASIKLSLLTFCFDFGGDFVGDDVVAVIVVVLALCLYFVNRTLNIERIHDRWCSMN